MKQLKEKHISKGKLTVITGLHIGGGNESVEIGGVDTPIIKIRTKNNEPYIPASAIKGKIRSLMEVVEGSDIGQNEKVNELFGWHGGTVKVNGNSENRNREPARIIFRDAYLMKRDKQYVGDYGRAIKKDMLDMPFTETKWENTINRYSGVANPRQIERIPASAVFEINLLINIYEGDSITEIWNSLNRGKELLENDYLGGNGTRGYGQVKIDLNEPVQVYPKSQSE